MGNRGKEFFFLALTTTAAILLLEPLIEKAILAMSPSLAAKVGISASA
jgi:N-acetyl-gamma-glutamylphosphate reductase